MTTLTGLAVYRLALEAFNRAGVFDAEAKALIATGIAREESGWRTEARGDTTITGRKWGPSIGLWQIRSLNAEKGTGGTRDELANTDTIHNADAMVTVSGHGTNWQPWSVWKNKNTRKRIYKTIGELQTMLENAEPTTTPEPTPPEPLTLEPPAWAAEAWHRITGAEMADDQSRWMMSPAVAPAAAVNRAELAVILMRFYDKLTAGGALDPTAVANAIEEAHDAIETSKAAITEVRSVRDSMAAEVAARLDGATVRLSSTATLSTKPD